MERSRKDLESLVTSQKEQLNRYETRLKDVVTAYKGLLKEKEALEASLAAVSTAQEKVLNKSENGNNESNLHENNTINKSDNHDGTLQMQIGTLMNSLATLSAEKSRMEASFQADKKQLRQEMLKKDKIIQELHEKLQNANKSNAIEVESMKSKIIVERHEREKESNNHMVMIRELQKLYADERHLKENLEMQLNDLKIQFSTDDTSSIKVKQLMNDLKQAKDLLNQHDLRNKQTDSTDSNAILQQLQNEMHLLKQQHAIAIKSEQKRAYLAEEQRKKSTLLHEDRVANLESRLAELSNTVGTYDRLRQQDQKNILKLKEKIAQLAMKSTETPQYEYDSSHHNKKDIPSAIDEIISLKKFILNENSQVNNPVDISNIFNVGADHTRCVEDMNKLQLELESLRKENEDLKEACDVQKKHIKTLQEKVTVLNRNIDEQEMDLKSYSEKLNIALKHEKIKWKEYLNTLENENRCKINEMEQQLQKQRVRSLQLLDEKENEIKTLKTSFEQMIPQKPNNNSFENESNSKSQNTSLSQNQAALSKFGENSNTALNPTENCPMLHYMNEIARKDVEITSLRKAKYSAESSLRQALQDKVAAQEELNDRIDNLVEQVDRLERCKTREGANLEYLKNVVISFLSTKSVEGKRHMINAIGAVLQFTPSETKAINSILYK